MKTYVEWQFGRGKVVTPTSFIPNGCGPKAAGVLSQILCPNELAGVDYTGCCNLHDLAYAKGGFWGLFWRKPKADIALGLCMIDRFQDAAQVRYERGGAGNMLKAWGTIIVGVVAAPLYTLAVMSFGWLPFIWRWRFINIKDYALKKFQEAM